MIDSFNRRAAGSSPRLVIFDIDGTLVDSVDLHAKAWQVAFAEFGKDISVATIRKQIGKGSDQLLPVFFSQQELDRFGDQLDTYRGEIFKRDYLPHVKAFPNVRDLFQRIKRDGKLIALASSAKKDELDAYKRIADIEDLVESETSSGDVEKSKPHPDVFAAALQRFSPIANQQVIVIGDTPYDAEAAGKLNLRTVGVQCGGWPATRLEQAGCIAVYRDPAELLQRYEQSPLSS
jgi:HAD superfamily hydrolase (TIGR01549 family)